MQPFGTKSFFIFSLNQSSMGLPTNDKTLIFGFYAIFRATSFVILVCYDQNISKSFNLFATSDPVKSVAKVSEMKKDFILGIPLINFMIPLSLMLLPLMSTDTKKGMLLAIKLQERHEILLFLIQNYLRFLQLARMGICSITYRSEMFLLLKEAVREFLVTLTFLHSYVLFSSAKSVSSGLLTYEIDVLGFSLSQLGSSIN